MGGNPERDNPSGHTWRRIRAGGWFAELTASTLATIIGIGLTFGIDAWVTKEKERKELNKSLLQAVDNLGERFKDTQYWMEKIEGQNRIYEIADSIYTATGDLPDSICQQFRYTMPYVKVSAFDHDFEKIFRGSYQLWQLQNNSDSLVYYIGECYDMLNTVETTCQTLTDGMIEEIGVINAAKHFHRLTPREWTLALITDSQFQYYMAIRWGKTLLASQLLEESLEKYDAKVILRSKHMRDE